MNKLTKNQAINDTNRLMQFKLVEEILSYALKKGILNSLDLEDSRNSIWSFLDIKPSDVYESIELSYDSATSIYELLNALMECSGVGTLTGERDYFISKITSLMMPRNSEVNAKFWYLYKRENARPATDWFYQFSIDTAYIRVDRTSKNVIWKAPSKYGELDITINLSKPEKSPEEIALAKTEVKEGYPKCMLCKENVGYDGTLSYPAKNNLRTIALTLTEEQWYFQYSPYVYYNEHAIVFSSVHRDMKIDKSCFTRLLEFVDLFPEYFIGSNADLHTVGGSILNHDHYQAGRYEMPMMRAKELYTEEIQGVTVSVLDWPLSVLSLRGTDKSKIINLADKVLASFIDYSDESVKLVSHSRVGEAHQIERHNTITPIARKVGSEYILYLALRNNRADENSPLGIFHPQSEHHHIKRENIGLIEVMGLAVLPARLVPEIEMAATEISESRPFSDLTEKHASWLGSINFTGLDRDGIREEIYKQIGLKYSLILEDSGIFKKDLAAFKKFITHVKAGL